jgi:predicted transcriptional regulator
MKKLFKLESKNVIISIKPEYGVNIIEGQKTIELRRKFPIEDVSLSERC